MGRYDWQRRGSARENSADAARPSKGAAIGALLSVAALGGAATLTFATGRHDSVPDRSRAVVRRAEHPTIGDVGLAMNAKRQAVISDSATTHSFEASFARCGRDRRTCVVDGDTFWLDGVKIRIADMDTPEISQPRCEQELLLGERATERLIALLNDGPFELKTVGDRDADRYGRKLRVVYRNGRSLGELLVAEGLAHEWRGRREPWCSNI